MTSPDVVIIGAGPSGILVWEQLTAAGLNAVLLEAGPGGPRGGYAPTSDPNMWAYRQAHGAVVDWLRIHAVGGRTVAWGGLCFRFPQSVFEGGDWPYGARTLAADYAAVETWLGVVEGRLQPHHRRAARRLDWPVLPLRGARLGGGRPWTARDAAGAQAARTHHVALGFDCNCGSAIALRVARPGGRAASAARPVFRVGGGSGRERAPSVGQRCGSRHAEGGAGAGEPSHRQLHARGVTGGAIVPESVRAPRRSPRAVRGRPIFARDRGAETCDAVPAREIAGTRSSFRQGLQMLA